ncbi:hypothetical protein K227x_11520 [Rubripirellula lacrimiformis]|uniref:Uncharacterized protein n=1 Tax=Rubripirellula lacrimiformis TaxID=1930273 RepID=A0A517N6K0_9BACT|nr:hypothetical protein [Rubripirellula lacrimiformis]QDT02774.1 hypothetical protein K227x_11520 [Rubripirellula lacrimiformis]
MTPRRRLILSVLLVGHLLAVVLPPLSFQTRGPIGLSPVIATLFAPLEGYSQALYMDRGYAFFAPDPGPSHLVQAAITGKDGNRVEQMIPDLEQQWPRLLYHRHFMLSEFLTEIYQPPGPPPELVELDRQEAENWVRARARYEHFRQSMVDHLESKNPGHQVAIRRIEHVIPDREQYLENPIPLDDPQLYRVLLDRPILLDDPAMQGRVGDLTAPDRPPETVPPPAAATRDKSNGQQPVDGNIDDASDLDTSALDTPGVDTPGVDTSGVDARADDPAKEPSDSLSVAWPNRTSVACEINRSTIPFDRKSLRPIHRWDDASGLSGASSAHRLGGGIA